MNNLLTSSSLTSIEQLNLNLLSTLNESRFFSTLTSYLKKKCLDGVFDCYLLENEKDLKSMIFNDKILKKTKSTGASGVMRMVSKNRSSYFSNNTDLDPLFENFKDSKFSKQLCVPVILEGVVFAILNIKRDANKNDFERSELTELISVLSKVTQPMTNLLMFLEAKRLNTVLQQKIEIKEANASTIIEDKSSQSEKIFKLVLRSRAMQKAKMLADKLAQSSLSFTIEGNLGTGKEFMARYIADRSARKESPFVIFDASTVDPILADVLLFGAKRDGMPLKEGLITKANGGTLLLKNVFLLPDNVQRKLLNVIKEKVFTRIGEEQFRKIDVRISITTREPLSKFYEEGRLRQDFFYEIARVTLNVPSLFDRVDDVAELASLFLNRGRDLDLQKSFTPAVLNDFRNYGWPGNVRELANLAERSYLLSDGMIIEKSGLEDKLASKEDEQSEQNNNSLIDENFVQVSLGEVEKLHICKTLEFLAGNKTKTAKSLGITVKTLYNKLHSYDLIESKK